MKLRKILNDFDKPKVNDHQLFAETVEGVYQYNFSKDDFQLSFRHKKIDDWYTIYKNTLIYQDYSIFWDPKVTHNHFRIVRFSEEQPFIEYKNNILFNDFHLYDDFFLCTYEQADKEIFVLFDPFTKEKKWEYSFDLSNQVRIIEWGTAFFVLLSNNVQLSFHSSQTGKVLWSFDISEYLMKDIPVYGDGSPIDKPKLQIAWYNPIYELLVLQLNPNKLLALDITTGTLRWVSTVSPSISWELDDETGDIYMTELLETNKASGAYRVIEGNTGKTLLHQDLTGLFDTKYSSGDQKTLENHHFVQWGDSVYLSFFEDGALYQLNKRTGELKNSYKHERGFQSAPIIHQNRLFLTDSTGENDTNLLVFEV
jgi:outer membrane protein assembly factor BamB